MILATMRQHENGMYSAEIRDNSGLVESAIIAKTAFEIHEWAFEHGADDLQMEIKKHEA